MRRYSLSSSSCVDCRVHLSMVYTWGGKSKRLEQEGAQLNPLTLATWLESRPYRSIFHTLKQENTDKYYQICSLKWPINQKEPCITLEVSFWTTQLCSITKRFHERLHPDKEHSRISGQCVKINRRDWYAFEAWSLVWTGAKVSATVARPGIAPCARRRYETRAGFLAELYLYDIASRCIVRRYLAWRFCDWSWYVPVDFVRSRKKLPKGHGRQKWRCMSSLTVDYGQRLCW